MYSVLIVDEGKKVEIHLTLKNPAKECESYKMSILMEKESPVGSDRCSMCWNGGIGNAGAVICNGSLGAPCKNVTGCHSLIEQVWRQVSEGSEVKKEELTVAV